MAAAHDVRRPLGEVLLEQGLITTDQLEQALAVQLETERQLGEVLVTLGFISPGVVANGLAEQSGGPLKTEYGISAGFGGSRQAEAVAPEVAEPAVAADPAPDVLAAWRTAVEQRDAVIERFRDELQQRNEHIGALSGQFAAATSRIGDLEAQLAERESLRAHTAPGTRVYDESSHLLYLPTPDGYRLHERAGPAPQPGEAVEVAGVSSTLVVARLGPSPLPGSALACAYLAEA